MGTAPAALTSLRGAAAARHRSAEPRPASGSPASPLQELQRSLGNRAVQHFVQARLEVSQPGDVYEEEADRVADQVMRMPESSPAARIQRMCAGCEEELQREAAVEGEALDERAGAIEPYVASLSGRGQALPESTRAYMEPRFGVDFSQVRVHTDSAAADSARAVDAVAFTVGRDIVFGAGRYALETERGGYLLAHELTHVVQQGGGDRAVQRFTYDRGEAPRISSDLGRRVARLDIPGWDCPRRLVPLASAQAEASGLAGIHNGPADAYRHCWWSCEVVKQCSAFSAHVAGAGHELDTLMSSESAMDLHNNSVGRECGSSPSSCDACCRERLDSGALTVMVQPIPREVEEARLSVAPDALLDADIGPAIELAQGRGDVRRASALIAELSRRAEDDPSFGVGLPRTVPIGAPGNALVTPQIALAMIENMLAGQPPFRPELGVGGVSWFVTEGTPHAGVSRAHTVPIQVDLIGTAGGLRFEQAELDRLFAEEEIRARPEVEPQVRERFRLRTGRDAPAELSRTLQDTVARQLRGLAERRMWERVGRQVAASPARVAEIILPAGGRFSANPGRFTLVGEASRIRLRGGLMPLLNTLHSSGEVTLMPELEQSAVELARALRLAGQVRTVFRVGGRILIVVAIAADIYHIITAEDHLEATFESVGGWAGASAAAAAFSAIWTPADVAGPWAWAGHGVGVLLSGAIGYWIGSQTVRRVYRLVVRARGELRTE